MPQTIFKTYKIFHARFRLRILNLKLELKNSNAVFSHLCFQFQRKEEKIQKPMAFLQKVEKPISRPATPTVPTVPVVRHHYITFQMLRN